MADATLLYGQDVIVCEVEIAAPPERVFRALTDPDQFTRWFCGSSCLIKASHMDARPDGSYYYATQESSVVVNGVNEFECHGKIIETDPPRLLAYTWIANWHFAKERKTIVKWELTAGAAGTQVKVTHSGLADEPAARDDYRGGWPGVVEKLRGYVET